MNVKISRLSSTLNLVNFVNMTVLIITLITFNTVYSSMAVAQTDSDSAAVFTRIEEYQRTFNTHNPETLAAFFTEDADFVMFNLPRLQGREAIENWWRAYWQSSFNKQEPGRRGTFVLNSVRFIAEDVAVVNVETTTGGQDTLGIKLHTRKARGTWVMLKQNGNWLITAMLGLPTKEDQIIRNIDKPEMEVEGTFQPVGPPLGTPVRNEIGKVCIVEIKQPYNITGTLTGKLEIDFRILVYGPCGEPPGTYKEEWIGFGSFNGTVDGSPASGKLTYTADVKAGGDVEGKIIFGQGIDGELIVKGNFKDGKLSYNGEVNEHQEKD